MIKLGVITSLNNNVEDNIRRVAELGLPTCQLKCWNSAFLTDEMADRAIAACREYGVEVSAFWCGWDGMSYWNFYEGPLTLGLVPRRKTEDAASRSRDRPTHGGHGCCDSRRFSSGKSCDYRV